MKKIIALALTLVLVLSMSVTVFASSPDLIGNGTHTSATNPETDAHKITLTVAGTSASSKVYYVEVKWDSLAFTYTFDANAKWDPTNHTYTNNTTGAWSTGNNTITAANHSNDDVNVTATVTDSINNDGVTVTVDKTTAQTIAAAIPNTDYDTASKVVFKVTPSGTPADLNVTAGTTIATVKITFAAGAAA